MDFIHESVALGVDLLILGLCVREYASYKNTVKVLKAAPQYNIDGELKNIVARQHDKKIPYAVIRGTVTPIGVPLRSSFVPTVSGVLQIVKLHEHRVMRAFAGFWAEQRKLLHESTNEMPFELCNQQHGVEIVDAISAAVLDVDVVYDNYESTSLSFFDHVFGFFTGVRQKGLQTTEQVLRDGSFLTAIGELEMDGQTLRMQPSKQGPLFLTTATKSTLIKRFEDAKSSTLFKIILCSSVSIVLVGLIVRKVYRKKRQEREEAKIRTRLESERRERRARSRPHTLTQDQLCVVCSTNPKEIILLPCGHVCLCEDCAQKIDVTCPVCRSKIGSKAAAFIA
ncbi:mitochondrial E3 ubiquitin protein ligase 1 [Drosophila grimshawi]|uniref:RING-type E3 ubiquitin transferase n=1 Tax=Drosophila grimshawi TaxID=7222 RepID=B4J0G9_DROGR|nr:mitochondrial E3 ubiquitin protein ligase 1 [Drosophila grimshawi]EDV96805.1 GH15008 [Drosophila grimshawi]